MTETTNPYASPIGAEDSDGNPLAIPGIALFILSIMALLSLVFFAPMIISDAIRLVVEFGKIQNNESGFRSFAVTVLTQATVSLFCFIAQVIALRGSISMMRRGSFRWAWRGASVSVIPVCSACLLLGVPFGVWALLLLSRPEVKQSFADNQ